MKIFAIGKPYGAGKLVGVAGFEPAAPRPERDLMRAILEYATLFDGQCIPVLVAAGQPLGRQIRARCRVSRAAAPQV
jgi:hypothetical protein